MNINQILNPQPVVDVDTLLTGRGPECNIEQDAWGLIDFTTGQVWHTTQLSDTVRTVQAHNPRLIGTTRLAVCTGVMIVTPRYALVAHFSPSGVSDDFDRFLLAHANLLQNGYAWLLHAKEEDTGAAVPKRVRSWDPDGTLAGGDLDALGDMLQQTLNFPANRIKLLMYKPPQDGAPLGNSGEESVLVDGRNSPAQFPRVYAQGFRQV